MGLTAKGKGGAFRRGNRPEARRDAFDYRSPADAKLMSASASPGRTWSAIAVERKLPVLAGAAATGVLDDCGRIAPVPGLGSTAEACVSPNLGNQDNLRREPGLECSRDRNLDRSLFPLSVAG